MLIPILTSKGSSRDDIGRIQEVLILLKHLTTQVTEELDAATVAALGSAAKALGIKFAPDAPQVDQTFAEALERALDKDFSHLVEGQVLNAQGQPQSGVMVSVLTVGGEPLRKERALAQTQTGSDGVFAYWFRLDGKTEDWPLVLQVSLQPVPRELVTPAPLRVKVARRMKANFKLEPTPLGAVNLKELGTRIAELKLGQEGGPLDGLVVEALAERKQVSPRFVKGLATSQAWRDRFVTGKVSGPAQDVVARALEALVATDDTLKSEEDLIALRAPELKERLATAVRNSGIADLNAAALDTVAAEFRRLQVDRMMTRTGNDARPVEADVLATAPGLDFKLLPTDIQRRLLERLDDLGEFGRAPLDESDDPIDLHAQLVTFGLQPDKAKSVQRTLVLDRLTGRDLPLISKLQSHIKAADAADPLPDLVKALPPSAWRRMAFDTADEMRVDPEARLNWVESVRLQAEARQPAAALLNRAAHGEFPVAMAAPRREALIELVQEIQKQGLDALAAPPDGLKDKKIRQLLDAAKEARHDLMSLRSLQAAGATLDESLTLLNAGITGPGHLVAMDRSVLADTLGFGPNARPVGHLISGPLAQVRLDVLVAGARQVQLAAVSHRTRYGLAARNGIAVIPSMIADARSRRTGSEPSPEEATLQSLFGSLDGCECSHCESVLSPSAYFVDLLNLLRNTPAEDGLTALDVFFQRRPDLQDLELSCENTEAEVPYIDLAMEVLQNAVALPHEIRDQDQAKALTDFALKKAGSNDPQIHVEVRSALGEVSDRTAGDLRPPIRLGANPEDDPGGPWLFADDEQSWVVSLPSEKPVVLLGADQRIVADIDRNDAQVQPGKVGKLMADLGLNTSLRSKAMPVVKFEVSSLIASKESDPTRLRKQLTAVHEAIVEPTSNRRLVEIKDVNGKVLDSVRLSGAPIDRLIKDLDSGTIPDLLRLTLHRGLTDWKATRIETVLGQPERLAWSVEARRPFLLEWWEGTHITSWTRQSANNARDEVLLFNPSTNPAADRVLAEAAFPWGLQLNLPLLELRTWLQRGAMPREQWLIAVDSGPAHARYQSPSWVQECLSLSHEQWTRLITAATELEGLALTWGLHKVGNDYTVHDRSSGQELKDADPLKILSKVSVLLQQSDIRLDQLQAFIAAGSLGEWVQPAVELWPSDGCDLSAMRLVQGANDVPPTEFFDLLHRATRLLRATGWTVRTLAQVLRASGRKTLDQESIQFVAAIHRLSARTGLSPDRLAFWYETKPSVESWTDHESPGQPRRRSPFELVFLAGASEESNERLRQLAINGAPPWADDGEGARASYLRTVLGCDEADAEAIVGVQRYKEPWTLDDFLKIFRAVDLSRHTGMTVPECKVINALTGQGGVDPLESPTHALCWLDGWERVKRLRISPVFLDALCYRTIPEGLTELSRLDGMGAVLAHLHSVCLADTDPDRVAAILPAMLAADLEADADVTAAMLDCLRPTDTTAGESLASVVQEVCVAGSAGEEARNLAVTSLQGLWLTLALTQRLSLSVECVRAICLIRKRRATAASAWLLTEGGGNPRLAPEWVRELLAWADVAGMARGMDRAIAVLASESARDSAQLADLDNRLDQTLGWPTGTFSAARMASKPAEISKLDALQDPETFRRLLTLAHRMVRAQAGAAQVQDWKTDLGDRDSIARGAQSARNMLKLRSAPGDWPAIARPVEDALRTIRRDALVALLVHKNRLPDANALYERYLIDPQMTPAMKTTRLLQATSAAQLFIQQLLFGRLKDVTLTEQQAARWRKRWAWMKSYRVWEANRKIFLFPENWLYPDVRDDKTSTFRKLEAQLALEPASSETLGDAMSTYVADLSDLADLRVVSLLQHPDVTPGGREVPALFVLAHDHADPRRYFWRKCWDIDTPSARWTGWEEIPFDIRSDHVIFTWMRGKLTLAWTTLAPVLPPEQPASPAPTPNSGEPAEAKILLNTSSLRNGKWESRKSSEDGPKIARINNRPWAECIAIRPASTPGGQDEIPIELLALKEEVGISEAWRRDFTDELKGDGNIEIFEKGISSAPSDRIEVEVATWEEYGYSPNVGDDAKILYRKIDNSSVLGSRHSAILLGGQQGESFSAEIQKVLLERMRIFGPLEFIAWSLLSEFVLSNGVQWAGRNLPFPAPEYFTNLNSEINNPSPRWVMPPSLNFPSDKWIDLYLNNSVRPSPKDIHLEVRPNLRRSFKINFIQRKAPMKDGKLYGGDLFECFPEAKASASKIINKGKFKALHNGSVVWSTGNEAESRESDGFHWRNSLLEGTPSGAANTSLPATVRQIELTESLSRDTKRSAVRSLQSVDAIGYLTQSKPGEPHRLIPAGMSDLVELAGQLGSAAGRRNDNPIRPGAISYGQSSMLALFGSNSRRIVRIDARDIQGRLAPNWVPVPFFLGFPGAIYAWETFVHGPLRTAQHLVAEGRYEDALSALAILFDPMSVASGSQPWRPGPLRFFAEQDLKQRLETISGVPSGILLREVRAWIDHPFRPHAIARVRAEAYQWAVVFAYLDTLIDWADHLFRQYRRETVNESILLYTLALRLLGPRPKLLPKARASRPKTFRTLGQGSAQATLASSYLVVSGTAATAVLADAGSLTAATSDELAVLESLDTTYFCLPVNAKVLAYHDKVEERLRHIRSSRNIDGISVPLPLYDPPIDPGLLVRAAAAGLDVSAAAAGALAPRDRIRAQVWLQRAKELTAEAKALGSAMLAAMEKRDGEALTNLRQNNEIKVLERARWVKQQQYNESVESLESMVVSRRLAVERLNHYRSLAGEAEGSSHTSNSSIATWQPVSVKPMTDSADSSSGSIRIYALEQAQLRMNTERQVLNVSSWHASLASSTMHTLDSFIPEVAGYRVHLFGGLGHAFGGLSTALDRVASMRDTDSTRAGMVGSYQRRMEDWTLQINALRFEIEDLDKRILAATIRRDIASREVETHEKLIEEAHMLRDFMRDKFANEGFYTWQVSQLASLYWRTFQMAHDLARRAERSYEFELGMEKDQRLSVVQGDHWDNLRQGLMAGEHLQQDLQRLELAVLERDVHEFEITQHISLRRWAPGMLMKLKEDPRKGIELDLPKAIFDLDYPGHEKRRIRSVALSMPCVAGPLAAVGIELTLQGKEIGAHHSIVTSAAQNDAGLFDANAIGERRRPFELESLDDSKWKIAIPSLAPGFDVDSISDLVIHLRYTARPPTQTPSGFEQWNFEQWKNEAASVQLATLISVRNDFQRQWVAFTSNKGSQLDIEISDEMKPALLLKAGKVGLNVDTSQYAVWLSERKDKVRSLRSISLAQGELVVAGDQLKLTIPPTEVTDELKDLIVVVPLTLDA